MNLYIKENKKFNDSILAKQVHGMYPYKFYFEVIGNSKLGKYIVVVSDKDVTENKVVDTISLKIDKATMHRANTKIVKPNTINGENFTLYRVRQVSMIDVGDTPMKCFVVTNKRNE